VPAATSAPLRSPRIPRRRSPVHVHPATPMEARPGARRSTQVARAGCVRGEVGCTWITASHVIEPAPPRSQNISHPTHGGALFLTRRLGRTCSGWVDRLFFASGMRPQWQRSDNASIYTRRITRSNQPFFDS
jgi:hypothetical protein